ncbi:serine/threonine-protein phosphatase [Paramixta manurensis]|uniref:Serine/threonine-protein phosphatase n=1 Tax=Paramixta manurensis TaxID=2740817 RepID=A0A6M8UER6_9GAMM|nr:serine/threonine-protein phosphatase [Erwiniaceae bacterium PD-1]
MNITFASITQQGARETNQDRLGTLLGEHSGCFVVCDGVAGLAGGQIAAKTACDTLLSQLDGDRLLGPAQTQQAIENCRLAIREQQRINPKFSQMSTTLAALFIDRVHLLGWWAHAGDSRVYHFRRGYLHQVTRDHSLAQQMREAGYENAGINSNLLYNALGAEAERGATYSELQSLEDGDAFLICSDGFWLNIATAEMEQALRMVSDCDEWLSLMQEVVNRSAKSDNLSAVAVWLGSPQDATLLFSSVDSARVLPPRD